MMCHPLVWCLVIFKVLFVTSFNLETVNHAVFQNLRQPQGSMFGFTVAVHKEGNTPWVLVGAPEAQSDYQRSVYRGGVVYKCRSDADNVCEEIPFDREGNHLTGDQSIDNKTMQWFGATLSSSGRESGPIVACAPRYVWFTKDLNRIDPVGTCYVSDGYFRSFEEYSPCRTIHWGYHRQGSCQAGFSAAINNDGDRLFVGAPGSYYWQGQMYSIDATARFNFTPGIFQESYGAKGSVYQQSLEKRPAVFSTQEGKAIDDDSYMGYSTIVGDFQGTGEQGIVVGMPRGAELHGKVLFFTWNLTNYKNMSSNKIGSYFGYSLAAADVDGDRRLDLIVGAPMHTETNNEGKYDVGRVYIFYQTTDGYDSFSSVDTLDGFNSKGRFGLSLSTLGDLNQDGFDDFAVGAPYDGKNGRGAVYIYYGSSQGVLEKYGQVIYAEDVSSFPVKTFGFSLTGGMDMDGNEYPDMAVGAYLSDTAFFFRARPVVRVEASVKFLTSNNQIDIKKPNCTLPTGPGTCTFIDFCVKYTGKGIPTSIFLNLQYILDTKTKGPARMAFMGTNKHSFNETIELLKDSSEKCTRKQIYIKSEIRDKLTPLEAEVKYFMTEDSRYYNEMRNPRSRLQPTLDLNSPPSKKDSIVIQKNCGSDNVCIPDLNLSVTSNVQKYLLGSNTNLEFDVIVKNRGEDAFETTFELKYPQGIYYKKIENQQNILCSSLENRTIQCQIGNPLAANRIASFRILFQPFHEIGMAPSYEFDMFVNSTNPEESYAMEDNHKHISIDMWVDADLALSGVSYPKEVQYNSSRYTAEKIRKESDIGPQVVHVYNVRNTGPATIEEAEIVIMWPTATFADQDLLYLLEQPSTLGDITCEKVPANYKNYELDYHTKSIWERLEIDTSSHEFTNSESLIGGRVHAHGSSSSSSASEVHIEQGSGIVGQVGGSRIPGKGQLDSVIGSSGDASVIHKQRLNETYTQGQITKQIQTYYHTYTVHGVPYRNETNVTTIRDGKGRILNQWNDTRTLHGEEAAQRFYATHGQPKIIYSSTGGQGGQTIQTQHQGSYFNQQQGGRGQVAQDHHEENYFRETSHQQGGIEDERNRQRWQGQGQQHGQTGGVYHQQGQSGGVYHQQSQSGGGYHQQSQTGGGYQSESHQGGGGSFRYQGGEQQRGGQAGGYQQQSQTGGGYQSESHQSGGGSFRYQGGEQQRGGQAGGSYAEHHQTSYESRQNQGQSQGSGRYDQQYHYGEGNQQSGGQVQVSGGNRYHIRARPGGAGHKVTITGRYELDGNQEQGGHQSGEADREEHYSASHQSSWGSKNVQDNVIQHGSGESGRHRGRGGYVDANGVFHAYSQNSSSSSSSSSGGFAEQAALGHGFTFNTLNVGGIQAHTESGHHGNPYQTVWHREETIEKTVELPPTYFNTIERDNVPTDRPDLNNPVHRGRRQADADECNSTKCLYIKCTVGTLKKDKQVSIALRSRVDIRAIREISSSQNITFSSMIVGSISKLPYIGKPRKTISRRHQVFTKIPAQQQELKPYVIPLWVVVLSAVAGTLALLLIIYLFYKCGFFKRNRPPTAPERQPLNRNGYHHGDEAL